MQIKPLKLCLGGVWPMPPLYRDVWCKMGFRTPLSQCLPTPPSTAIT